MRISSTQKLHLHRYEQNQFLSAVAKTVIAPQISKELGKMIRYDLWDQSKWLTITKNCADVIRTKSVKYSTILETVIHHMLQLFSQLCLAPIVIGSFVWLTEARCWVIKFVINISTCAQIVAVDYVLRANCKL